MTKSVLATLSLSFFTLAAAVPSPASQQGEPRYQVSAPIEATRPGGSTQAEIDLGWEHLQQLIKFRIAERSSDALSVPGAIISTPFSLFAPYSAEVPSAMVAGKTPKPAIRAARSRGVGNTKS